MTTRMPFIVLRDRRSIRRGLALVLLWIAAAGAHAASNTLTALDATASSTSGITIRLTLSGPAPMPSVFTVNEPARLSIDLPDTGLAVSERYRRIEQGPVDAIALAEGDNRTRVVIELSTMANYDIGRSGNEIIVGVGGASAGNPSSNAPTATGASTPPAASSEANYQTPRSSPGPTIRDIDFRRGEEGAGRIELLLQGVTGAIDVNERDGTIIANLPGVTLPGEMERRLDVLDFATPVKTIDAMNRGGGARIVVTPVAGADFEQIAYQTGDRFYIELQPLTVSEQAEREERQPQYEGERISLSFQNIDVRAVLQIIADVADVNMVVSDSVSGNMALRLEDVPWDQALDIIMQSKGLGMRRQNNVITVAPLAEIAAREQAELAAQEATKSLAPLRSEILQINYARAGEIAALLRSSTGELSLLSQRGQVSVDERTNSLLINETREKLDEIRRVINRLDIPVRQVLIESRIVVANREFSRNLGVSASVIDRASPSGDTGGFTIDLPVSDGEAAGTFSTTLIGSSFNVDLALTALESENRGEIISSPRVITANAKEAKIEQGVEIPYLEAASSGAATVEFKEAVLGLTVTPQITPDERVIMDLFVTQDTQGDTINVQGGGSVPSINTRSLTTQVLVDDGETVVLGGIYEQEDRDVQDRIPILGELPLVGGLFRRSLAEHDKRELLLFVTPRILKDNLKIP